jgi:iron complex outermembrane receptor protein
MFNKKLFLAVSFSALVLSQPSNAVIGPIKITLNPTELSSNYFNEVDTNAPFSSEVYSENEIKNSKTNNIYDFLTQNTSLSLAPSSGNKFSQKISMRGYGLTVGSHNLIINLNGKRLNNIDTSGPDINSIIFDNIEKIEIIKGSGSVFYGDSAMSGVINIYTKKNVETKLSTSMGNFGYEKSSASVGINRNKIDLNISIDSLKHGGYGAADPKGFRDDGKQEKSSVSGRYTTNKGTEIQLDFDQNSVDNRYPNYLTTAQWHVNPAQNWTGRVYTFKESDSSTISLNINRKLTDNLSLSRSSSWMDKDTVTRNNDEWGTGKDKYGERARYDYDSNNANYLITYNKNAFKIDGGYSSNDGSRYFFGSQWTAENQMKKENKGLFSQIQYTHKDTVYSIGARKERVEYTYSPSNLFHRTGKHKLEAFNAGFNTRLNNSTTLFSNFNQAFQAPLIDRFFSSSGAFNGFMNPSTSKTLNLGLNYLTDKSKTKVTVYRSNIEDEMYYDKPGGKNTNLDESHKQGLEFQNLFEVTPKLSTNINYAYTDAKIDKEDGASGAYNGKTNPMTSKHNLSASMLYSFNDKLNLTLTQKYRSEAFAEEDYSNTSSQKQKPYYSTNFNLSYNVNNDLNFSFDIENLFEKKYGTQLRSEVIYPGNYTRNVKAALSYKF